MDLSNNLEQTATPEKTRASLVDLVERAGAPESGRSLVWALAGILSLVLLLSAARFAGWPSESFRGLLTDFHDFYLAGLLVRAGEIGRAYHLADLMDLQKETFGNTGMLPWTYPPPFDLVVAALASLPIGIAYLVFAGSTLVAYLLTLRRLTPDWWMSVVLLLAPVFIVTLRSGQNGFLTGAFMASAAIGLIKGRAWAGVPLGLMLIKPHLAVTFALYVLLTRRWDVLGVAVLVAAAACLAATLELGPGIWGAFFDGVVEASEFLARGLYPNFRMVSVYALARSFDLSASVGAAAQVIFTTLALGATGIAALRLPPRSALGVAGLAALMVSPYAYDYDLPIFGVGLALVWPDLQRRIGAPARAAFYGLALATQGVGFAFSVANDFRDHNLPFLPSFGAVTLIAALTLAGLALLRKSRDIAVTGA